MKGAGMADRNAAICRAYDAGYTQADIGRAFGLSTTRIGDILDDAGTPRRSPCLLALIWDGRPLNTFDASGS